MPIQSTEELEAWHSTDDPWEYESNPEDARRRDILLSELPERVYDRVLDIGCGQGFLTHQLPGRSVVGVDISSEAILRASRRTDQRVSFQTASIFGMTDLLEPGFDLIVITGVLYPQYIGQAFQAVRQKVDMLLASNGVLCSVHIESWTKGRFPYALLREHTYQYREYRHRLEIYIK